MKVAVEIRGYWECPSCGQAHDLNDPHPQKGRVLQCANCEARHRVGYVLYDDPKNKLISTPREP